MKRSNREYLKLTADDIVKALQKRYPLPHWFGAEELHVGSAFGIDSDQRIDYWTLDVVGLLHETISFEIKVSRSDYLHELANPYKREVAQKHSNWYYFVVPRFMVTARECPKDAGLMWVYEDGRTRVMQRPPFNYQLRQPPTWRLISNLARNKVAQQLGM